MAARLHVAAGKRNHITESWQGRSQDEVLPAGLPSDPLSVENALVITQSIRTAFIIDPSSQAPNWLQAHMQAQKAAFETATMHDGRCAEYMPALSKHMLLHLL